jgi:hypothetical protein
MTLNVKSYPRSFSVLSTRARGEIAVGDTASARRDATASLRLEPASLRTQRLAERLRLMGSTVHFLPAGTYRLREAAGSGDMVLVVADTNGVLRATLTAGDRSYAFRWVTAAADHLWASTNVYPNELPGLSLVARGDSVVGRFVVGFGTNRAVAGRRVR